MVAYWCNNKGEAECSTCHEIKPYSDFNMFNEKYRNTYPNRRPVQSLCKIPCVQQANAGRYDGMSMEERCYDRGYKDVMRVEGNEVDLTFEEFMEHWPKDNRCPVRNDIIFQRYPQEDKELWTKGGRHWPFTPTVDHIKPDQPLSKDNFWIVSWRANEMKTDMFKAEIEALYHALMQRQGKLYIGDEIFEIMDVQRKINDISSFVGKYTPERLESIRTHRKL